MPDFRLQRFRDGWAIAVYEGGKRLSRRGLDARDASAASAEFERIVAELKRPIDPDVATIWEAYREDRAGRRIALNMDFSGRAVLPFFGRMRPEEIKVKTCREYVAMRRKAGRKNGTIGTELNHLRIALKWAHKGRMIGHLPAIEMPPKPPAKERYLTRKEAAALLDASETPHLRLFIVLAISTAARAGALFDLTWDRVDFDRGLIYLGARLALRPRKGRATVPMTDQCRAALSEARHGALTGFVIEWGGSPVKSVRTALAKAAARAGVDGVSPHVLRHTAAVWMAEAGIPMSAIAQYLGHSDSSITEKVYSRFGPEYLRNASVALEI
jgi:integrase